MTKHSKVVRGTVLLSSSGVALLLVSQAGVPGCDRPPAPEVVKETPKADASKADAPKADTPKVDTPKADAPKVDAPKADTPKAEAPKVEANLGNAAPHYFPASKSGVFIEPAPQTPQQQAGAK